MHAWNNLYNLWCYAYLDSNKTFLDTKLTTPPEI